MQRYYYSLHFLRLHCELAPSVRTSLAWQASSRRCFQSSIPTFQEAYTTLGISKRATSEEIKRSFIELALRYHPDRADGHQERFVEIRQAFEELCLKNDSDSGDSSSSPPCGWSQHDLKQWYQQQTGDFLTFDMSEATRKEVIHVYRTMSAGGKDKGGYWEMARQLAEKEDNKQGGDEEEIKLLEASDSGLNRRKRRR